MSYSRNSSRIPRSTLTARRRVKGVDTAASSFANKTTAYTYTEFPLLSCTKQPYNTYTRSYAMSEGLRSRESYIIRTATPMVPAQQGSDEVGDQVRLGCVDGIERWFSCIYCAVHDGGVINHYECVVVRTDDQ